jgi:hypothetical protein
MKRPRKKPFANPDALVHEERLQFRALLENEIFRKAMARVLTMKPSAFHVAPGPQAANDRLYEIRGWELFEHALYLQAEAPKPKAARPTETFPDEGLIDHE